MFAKVFYSTIKGIHLTLEMKTSFGNSMPVLGSSTESGSQKHGVPTDSHNRYRRKREEKRPAHQRVTKQILSDYA
jgi:hypothetical protein